MVAGGAERRRPSAMPAWPSPRFADTSHGGRARRARSWAALRHVAPREEDVEPVDVGPNHAVAQRLREPCHRHRRGAHPSAGTHGARVEAGLVRHHPILAAELGMRLGDDEPRPDAFERLPDPVVVSVDVDREQIDVTREPCLGQDVVDVLARHERSDERRRANHGVGVLRIEAASSLDQRLVGVDEQAVEAQVEGKVAGCSQRPRRRPRCRRSDEWASRRPRAGTG